MFAALCAASLSIETFKLLKIPVDFIFVTFAFVASICSYNFHMVIASIKADKTSLLRVFYKTDAHFFLMVTAGPLALLLFLKLNIQLTALIAAMSLTGLYSLPLVPLKKIFFLRRFGFIKTILLAFTWSFVTVYLPLNASIYNLPFNVLLLFVQRFIFMLILCLIFDNRDIASDRFKGLHSLATDITAVTMNRLVCLLFAGLVTINSYLVWNGISLTQSIALQTTALVTFILYRLSAKKQSYHFYYFYVDGMMILSALLTTIASI